MADKTLEQLRNPLTLEQTRQKLTDRLVARASTDPSATPITQWIVGGAYRTLFENEAEVLTDFGLYTKTIAEQGYSSLATDENLDICAFEIYQLTRNQATFCLGKLTLTSAAGSPSHTIDPDQLWVRAGQFRFSILGVPNGSGGFDTATLNAGATLEVHIRAEGAGRAWNVPATSINRLETPLTGVTISNAPDWILSAGTDIESDLRLAQRCQDRWKTDHNEGTVTERWEAHARAANPAITKVQIKEGVRGRGTLDIVLAGNGGLGTSIVTDDRLNPSTQNTPPFYPSLFTAGSANMYLQRRRPLGCDLQMYAATQRNEVLAGTIIYKTGFRSVVETAIVSSLQALEDAIPIGGSVTRTRITDALIPELTGGVDATLTTPSADIVLSLSEELVFTFISSNFTWIEV